MDIRALKTAGAWVGLVTTLVLVMMAVTRIITPGDAMFYVGGVFVGLLFSAYSHRNDDSISTPVEPADEPTPLTDTDKPAL